MCEASTSCFIKLTVETVLSDGTQWTVKAMVAIMEMVTIERPWPDRRYATTSECARDARPAGAGRGRAADDARHTIIGCTNENTNNRHTHRNPALDPTVSRVQCLRKYVWACGVVCQRQVRGRHNAA